MSNLNSTITHEGDLVLLVGVKHKNHLFRLESGKVMQTHRGEIRHDDLIGQPWGSVVQSHIGRTFTLLEPTLAEVILELPRRTQIMYPKDIGFILMTIGVRTGSVVGEAGCGSGAMTLALSEAVGPDGHVYSYDLHPDSLVLARKNLARFGKPERVTFQEADIELGLDQSSLDAFFLDVPNPERAVGPVRAALKPGGGFCCIVPTANQASVLLRALEDHRFAFIDVCEIMLRYYRSNPERFRPTDRMVAHTGYLVFARPVYSFDAKESEDREELPS